MSMDALVKRAGYLKEELDKAGATLNMLTQQLQQQTIHMHTVNGHFQEVAYLLGEAQKEAGLVPDAVKDEVAKDVADDQGDTDGEADCENEKINSEE